MSPLVILAAGMGERLKSHIPKSLQLINNTPLLMHQINRFNRQGIDTIYIITGYKSEDVQTAVLAYPFNAALKVHCINNPNWEKGNGTSVHVAAQYLKQSFYLTMADHIFSDRFIQQFVDQPLLQSTLVTDELNTHNAHLDIEDVTKVQIDSNNYIINIGKTLTDYNQIDTGLFYLTTDIEPALESSQLKGDFSLSSGIKQLALQQKIKCFNCNKEFWMDIDTPSDFDYANLIENSKIFA